MALATPADVAARLGRPLNPGEVNQVSAYLEDAQAAIVSRLPDIMTAAETDDTLRQNLISVECSVTLRAARITDSIQAAYPAPEGLTPAPANRANVTVLDTEWRKLGQKWFNAFSMSQNNAAAGGSKLAPGSFPDRGFGPWWTYAISDG